MTRGRKRPHGLLAVALIGAVFGSAGCSSGVVDSIPLLRSNEKPVEANILPADFKNQILHTVSSVIVNPNNIRDAFYSDPMVDPKGSVSVYTSCVRMNARDGSLQYTGPKDYILYYYGGRLNQFVVADAGQCRFAAYKPFPELEKFCPSGKCS